MIPLEFLSFALLASKRSFKDTQVFHNALKRLADGITKHGGCPPTDAAEAQDFQRLFDIFRQPEPGATKPLGDHGFNDDEIKRLELALIKERYVTGNTGAPDWRRVFESICPPR